jgi:hypothetical protein
MRREAHIWHPVPDVDRPSAADLQQKCSRFAAKMQQICSRFLDDLRCVLGRISTGFWYDLSSM